MLELRSAYAGNRGKNLDLLRLRQEEPGILGGLRMRLCALRRENDEEAMGCGNVVVHKDGSMRVDRHLLNTYRNKTYNTDFSGLIEAVDDYGADYNCQKTL